MSRIPTPTLPLVTSEAQSNDWPTLPTETEIYILPDGRIVIADLPAEFATWLPDLGLVESGLPASATPGESSSPEPSM